MRSQNSGLREWVCVALAWTCAGSLVAGQQWRQLPPPAARSLHAVAFDSTRGVTVLFGGMDADGAALADTWELAGTAWSHVPTAVSPPARSQHAMVYDPVRQVVVLFGGRGNLADTWEYDGTTWSQIAPSTSPRGRSGHAMVYDAARGVVVMFGGQLGISPLDDTWEYDGSTWTQITPPSSPPGRAWFAMAYDPDQDRTVLFGGHAIFRRLGDTWEYTGATQTWRQITPLVSPSARRDHAMSYDAVNRQIVMFGGYGSVSLGDTWAYDTATARWMQLSPPVSPPPCYRHSLAYDTRLGRVVLFGGAAPQATNDTWLFDGVTWTQTGLAGPTPSDRSGAGFVFDGLRRRGVLFGGLGFARTWQTFADTWELDGEQWTQIRPPTSPPARGLHGFAYDAARGRVVMYGGYAYVAGQWISLNDTWEYDVVTRTWTEVPTATAPNAGVVYAMTYDAARRKVVVFGGGVIVNDQIQAIYDATWEYDGVARTWTEVPIPAHGRPSARLSTAIEYDAGRGKIVLFGGMMPDGSGGMVDLGDTWEYDGFAQTWTRQLHLVNAPTPRSGSRLAYDSSLGRIVMHGGGDRTSGTYRLFDELWLYDGAGATWTQVSATGPRARATHGFLYDWSRDRLVIFGGGGSNAAALLDDTWEYRLPALPHWSRYGLGCAGSNGVPALDAAPSSVPALGGTLALQVTNLPTVMGVLALGVGFDLGQVAGRPLPLDLRSIGMGGCDLWVGLDPALTRLVGHLGHRRALAFTIPNQPTLAGRRFAMQAIVFDAAAPNGCASVSNAGIATIY